METARVRAHLFVTLSVRLTLPPLRGGESGGVAYPPKTPLGAKARRAVSRLLFRFEGVFLHSDARLIVSRIKVKGQLPFHHITPADAKVTLPVFISTLSDWTDAPAAAG